MVQFAHTHLRNPVLDESESEDPDYSPDDEALAPVPEEEYYEDPEELEEHDEEEDLDGMYFLQWKGLYS